MYIFFVISLAINIIFSLFTANIIILEHQCETLSDINTNITLFSLVPLQHKTLSLLFAQIIRFYFVKYYYKIDTKGNRDMRYPYLDILWSFCKQTINNFTCLYLYSYLISKFPPQPLSGWRVSSTVHVKIISIICVSIIEELVLHMICSITDLC